MKDMEDKVKPINGYGELREREREREREMLFLDRLKS